MTQHTRQEIDPHCIGFSTSTINGNLVHTSQLISVGVVVACPWFPIAQVFPLLQWHMVVLCCLVHWSSIFLVRGDVGCLLVHNVCVTCLSIMIDLQMMTFSLYMICLDNATVVHAKQHLLASCNHLLCNVKVRSH